MAFPTSTAAASIYARGINSGWIERYRWDKELERLQPSAGVASGIFVAPGEAERNPGYEQAKDSGHRASDKASSMAVPALQKPARSKGIKPLNEFHAWIKKISPPMFDWDAPHLKHVIEKLQLFTEGKIKRLMIFMPPRHGKSELVTTRYTAWRLLKDPTLKVILASYAQALANPFSRNIRNTLAEYFYQERSAHGNTQDLQRRDAETQREPKKPKNSPGSPPSPDIPYSQDFLSNPFRSRIINSAAEWETGKGGGVKAVGVGGGITGYGAKLMMIDDPIKSREQAESASYRDKVWHWFNDDMMTRLEPGAGVVLIQTRWHEDDLAGRLLKQQQEEGTDEWHVINLPAICEEIKIRKGSKESQFHFETPEEPKRKEPIWIWRDGRKEIIHSIGGLRPEFQHEAPPPPKPAEDPADYDIIPDPLGRKIGEALWPQRFDIKHLERIKRQMGTYSFESLYQQKPVPTEGGMFKRSWFSIVQVPPPNLNWKRGYDLSFTANPDSDPSATLKVAYDKDGTIYIDGCFRGKLTYPLQRKMLVHYIKSETRTEHGIELSANGHALLQELRRMPELYGKKFRGVKVDSNKLTRALPWIALAEERRIRLVAGRWNEDFIAEACSFPHGTNDDQIDAVSVAIAMHGQRSSKRLWSF